MQVLSLLALVRRGCNLSKYRKLLYHAMYHYTPADLRTLTDPAAKPQCSRCQHGNATQGPQGHGGATGLGTAPSELNSVRHGPTALITATGSQTLTPQRVRETRPSRGRSQSRWLRHRRVGPKTSRTSTTRKGEARVLTHASESWKGQPQHDSTTRATPAPRYPVHCERCARGPDDAGHW